MQAAPRHVVTGLTLRESNDDCYPIHVGYDGLARAFSSHRCADHAGLSIEHRNDDRRIVVCRSFDRNPVADDWLGVICLTHVLVGPQASGQHCSNDSGLSGYLPLAAVLCDHTSWNRRVRESGHLCGKEGTVAQAVQLIHAA
jgi:hypothetical protein